MQNNNRPPRPLDQLYDIINDLWGSMPQPGEKLGTPAPAAVPEAAAEPAEPAPAPSAEIRPQPEANMDVAYQQAFPPFEQFWKVADESVDWTEALAHAHPRDGLTSQEMWHFFHEHAASILDGDVNAYVEVLKAANPLGDLLPYARGFNVKAESPDRLSVCFEGLPSYLNQAEGERRRYLAGICLRAARDLMALLPVREAAVTANQNGQPLLTVTFTRQELQKVPFSFVDPVAFAIACGGKFTGSEE